MLPHKEIVFPAVDLSDDDGDPVWPMRHEIYEQEKAEGEHHYRWLCPPRVHHNFWEVVKGAWDETSRAYEVNPDSFHDSWHYLNDHPMFWKFTEHRNSDKPKNHVSMLERDCGFGSNSIDVMVVLVDGTGTINEDDSLNTQTEVWLETGKWNLFADDHEHSSVHCHWHDIELDCGGPTYEAAVITLARLVWEKYGNDRLIADAPPVSPMSPVQS